MNNQFLLRVRQPVFVMTFVLMLLAMCWQTSMHLIDYFHGVYGYENGCINDMLINYEGGFVRRGLFGELLFFARTFVSFSVANAMVALYYLGFLLLAVLLVHLFRRNGWSLFILPFPICLYVYLCDPYILVGRRDCWLLMLTCVCYYFYRNYVVRGGKIWIVLCAFTLIIALLLHEASLFFIFPIIATYDMNCQYTYTRSLSRAALRFTLHWWAVGAVVFLIIICHGDDLVIRGFWESWAPYVDVTEKLITDSYVSRTLNYSFWYNMTVALWPSTWLGCLVWKIPVWPFNLYLFICTYYLVTRFNTIHLGAIKKQDVDIIQLSNVVLTLFCSMFVFMSFVSCDWGRDFPYWVICSFMFFHFFQSSDISPSFLTKLSQELQGRIDRSSFLNSQWGYYILLVTLPLGFMGASISGMFPFIPLTLKHILMGQPMAL